MSRFIRPLAGFGLVALVFLGGCAAPPVMPASPWQEVRLPGKAPTEYRWVQKDGAEAVHARAARSASMLRRPVARDASTLADVEFAWLVTDVPAQGDVSQAETEDAAARVVFAFEGDEARLSARNRLLFDLARTLTGESPPYATLMYVWDATAPVGTVIVNPRTDRVRKIVVESGRGALGQWKHYRRNLVDDFRLAFGEAPGRLQAVGLMTDGDNTQSTLSTWYRDVTFH
jgi:hypothetical protein